MKFPINFFYHNHLNFLLFRAICFGLRKLIEIIYFNESMPLFLMFLGENLSIFIHLYQKYILLREIEKEKMFDDKTKDIKQRIKIYFIIFIISLCDLIGCYNFKYIGNNKTSLKNNFNMIFLCVFIALNEYIYLKIQIYNYHILGYILYIFSLIIDLLINMNEFKKYLINILIISLGSQYIESLFYIFEKKLNYEYFIKISEICFLEGLFGMIILLIFYLLPFTSFNLLPKEYNILIIIIYCILTCIANLCRLRVTEISRPSYNMIGKTLCNLSINIVSSIFENENKKYTWNKINILIMFISLISAFIYCEVITLNFFNFDKYITDNIIDRSIRESISLSDFQNYNEDQIIELFEF